MTIANGIKDAIKEMGISQAEFARRLKVHRSYVTRWCGGDVPRLDMLKKIARLIGRELVFTGNAFGFEKRAA